MQSKIKFLVNKIEQMQMEGETASKPSLGSVSALSADMVQSKMVQSSASIDSFRVTPNMASSGSMATRRNTSGAKTPSKYAMTNRHRNPLGERNY